MRVKENHLMRASKPLSHIERFLQVELFPAPVFIMAILSFGTVRGVRETQLVLVLDVAQTQDGSFSYWLDVARLPFCGPAVLSTDTLGLCKRTNNAH